MSEEFGEMHELSIARNLVEIATEAAGEINAKRVAAIQVRLGALSGVVKEALLFSYEVATAGTILAGSRLKIEELPVVIFCPQCQVERKIFSIQYFACPVCDAPASNIVQGREIEIVSLEIIDDESSP